MVCYYKVRQLQYYYKLKCDKNYYKVWQVLQNEMILLQSVTIITKFDSFFTIKSGKSITKWDRYYLVIWFY